MSADPHLQPRNPNTKINAIPDNDDSEYSKELKLNIRCDEDDSHIAVIYCPDCKCNLCKKCSDSFHSRKAVSKHQIVRLTKKPEQPIYCSLHPEKKAELVCKESSCKGVNQPMCTMCHQYETHKDHKYEMLENEYDNIRTNITNCLKEIKINQAISYSTTDSGFWKTERDKIEKLYSDAKTSALSTFDDFLNGRTESLKLLKNKFTSDKMKLDNMSSELRNIEEIKKKEIIENGGNVEKMMIQAGKRIDDSSSSLANLIPSERYKINCPKLELMGIQIEILQAQQSGRTVSPKIVLRPEFTPVISPPPPPSPSKSPSNKIHAVFFIDYLFGLTSRVFKSKPTSAVEERRDGILYTYNDYNPILKLIDEPNDRSANLSAYKYIAVIHCWSNNEEVGKATLARQMKSDWWGKIIILIDALDWDTRVGFVNRVREVAKNDNRVEFMKFDKDRLIESLLQD